MFTPVGGRGDGNGCFGKTRTSQKKKKPDDVVDYSKYYFEYLPFNGNDNIFLQPFPTIVRTR